MCVRISKEDNVIRAEQKLGGGIGDEAGPTRPLPRLLGFYFE